MNQNPFPFLGQTINQLLTAHSAGFEAIGLSISCGLAIILIVRFVVKVRTFVSQGGGGFHFAEFANLILMIAFGLGMATYYSTEIPGTGYSFSNLGTEEVLSLPG